MKERWSLVVLYLGMFRLLQDLVFFLVWISDRVIKLQALMHLNVITERFYSRGQHQCNFIGAKESLCIRKEFNSQRTGLGHKHGRRFIVLGHQYGRRDVM